MLENTATRAAFPKYPAYKDSGVEWLGEIPEGWEVKRLGVFGYFSKGGGFSKSDLTYDGFPAILYGDIYTKYELKIKEPVRFISLDTAKKSVRIKKGDLLFTGSGETKEDIGKCVVLDCCGDVYAGGDVIVYKQSLADSAFLSYYLNTQIVKNEKAKTAKGEIIVHTYASKLREIRVCLPPLPTQTAIANFLDDKTKKIDQAIAQKEKLISLLKERKQIVIQNAVTGKWSMVNGQWSMTPKERMKDSGVEWIGEIPEGWEVIQVRKIASTTSGSTPQSGNIEKYYNGSIPWVRTTDLNNDELYDTPVKITEAAIRDTACSLMPVNTVCIAMYGGPGTIGKHSILRFSGTINQALCGIMPSKRLNQEYLYYYVKYYRPHWMFVAKGSRVDPNISQDEVGKMFIPLLSLQEQATISAFIETQSAKIDQAIALQQTQIEKLKEYKATLIDSAVTGKIMVNG